MVINQNLLNNIKGYDGKTDVEAWLKKFEVITSACQMNEAEKLTYLPAYLEGDALEFVCSLANKSSLEQLKVAMVERFGCDPSVSQAELRRIEMVALEDYQGFASKIVKLVDRSYPNFWAEDRKTVYLEKFLVGIQGDVAEKFSTNNDIKTLKKATKMCIRIESARKLILRKNVQWSKKIISKNRFNVSLIGSKSYAIVLESCRLIQRL